MGLIVQLWLVSYNWEGDDYTIRIACICCNVYMVYTCVYIDETESKCRKETVEIMYATTLPFMLTYSFIKASDFET